MSELIKIIHEQLTDYTNQLKELETEMVRKYKDGEDYSKDLEKARGLKELQNECLFMIAEKS